MPKTSKQYLWSAYFVKFACPIRLFYLQLIRLAKQSKLLEDGTDSPEASVTRYYSTLCKIPEVRRRRRKSEMTNVSRNVLEFAWKDRQNLHKSLLRTVNYLAEV
jgi:hypothetical protein